MADRLPTQTNRSCIAPTCLREPRGSSEWCNSYKQAVLRSISTLSGNIQHMIAPPNTFILQPRILAIRFQVRYAIAPMTQRSAECRASNAVGQHKRGCLRILQTEAERFVGRRIRLGVAASRSYQPPVHDLSICHRQTPCLTRLVDFCLPYSGGPLTREVCRGEWETSGMLDPPQRRDCPPRFAVSRWQVSEW